MHYFIMHALQPTGVFEVAMLTVRNIPQEVHRALRVRAAQNGHSMEAEVRTILLAAVNPQQRVKLGSLLAEIGGKAKLSNAELAVFEGVRGKEPSRFVSF
jgi:antitoxin FitA